MGRLDTVWLAPHSVNMRECVGIVAGLLLYLNAGAQAPTPQQLGKALAIFSPDKYKTAPIIRQVQCQYREILRSSPAATNSRRRRNDGNAMRLSSRWMEITG
jgi:hypothetical protein